MNYQKRRADLKKLEKEEQNFSRDRVGARIAEENTLINARTVIFLIANGFFVNAIGTYESLFFRVILCLLGLVVTLIWFISNIQVWKVLTALHEVREIHFPGDKLNRMIFEKLQWKSQGVSRYFGPSELIAIWLPLVLLISWTSIFFAVIVAGQGKI